MKRSEWTAGDDNVARLLGQPHDPPSVPADFAQRVQTRLLEVAAEIARQRTPPPRRVYFRPQWPALAGVAALLGIFALGLRGLPRSVSLSPPLPAVNLAAAAKGSLAPGATIVTGRGECRRVKLSDGSVLSLNENTRLHHDALRHLVLSAGEIFVEVAPRLAGKVAAPFTVATPDREIRSTGTKFLVRAEVGGTGVAVTQGHVQVSDWDGLLSAGQQLSPKADTITPLPRLSYLLDWTRDLVVAAAPPLVPASAYSGGALVAFDPQGHAGNLHLRTYHIDVHIEDGFARTTIDQTYFNPTLGRLEGTFFFPLPADASLSRLVMYVDGQRMEGGMVERDYGRMVFDQIVTKMKDPALLEWVDGHTFKMRVFPLEPRQEKRILLSYTQRLPNLFGRWSYRFPAGHSLGSVREWSFHVRVKDGKNLTWRSDSHTLTPRFDKDDLLLDARANYAAMERDLTLNLAEQKDTAALRFATAMQDGSRYLMLRYRPDLPGAAKRQRRDWVFLFESSAERDPLVARTQTEIIRTLLTNAEHDDTFAILTADTQVHSFAASPLRATPENIGAALGFLEKAHLLGALDLDAGLKEAAAVLHRSEHPVLVHLGCGRAVLGERRTDVLTSRIPRQTCYVGVGVGKGGASDFMRRAAAQRQGYVAEINPDEAVAWRAFDLLAALNTPRLNNVRVEDANGKTRFLLANSIVSQGEELCAIARLPDDAPLPRSVIVAGMLDGRPYREELRVESPRPEAAYLPRTWARLEIDRLLAEDAVKNKGAIIALSKAMYVMTPYTSLLVLENEAMYAKYKVDRGRKDHWAMYPCPAKIPVVSEPPAPTERLFLWSEHTNQPDFPSVSDRFMWQERAAWSERRAQPGRQYVTVSQAEADEARRQMAARTTPHPNSYTIQLEPPSIYRATITVESDAQLQERIRRENRERNVSPTGWMMNPYQGYLSGAADASRSQTPFGQGIQQAKLVRQEMIRPSLQSRRTRIEEAEWERGHMPDPEKIRQQALERELSRARHSPPLNDVWSAHSLNVLLRHLIAQQSQGATGPPVPLSEDVLNHIHLSNGAGGANLAVLKDNGHLQWPVPLQNEMFKEGRAAINRLLHAAYKSVMAGNKPDNSPRSDLRAAYRHLKDTLERVGVEQLTPDEYIEAARYLKQVSQVIEVLKEPNAAAFLKDIEKPKARNVAELVRFLGEKKLTFAPATPKDEPAYIALYHALAAFDAGLSRPDDKAQAEKEEHSLVEQFADPVKAKQPSLWRRAAQVAQQRQQYASALQRLRRALELDKNRPRDLRYLRGELTWFLHLTELRVQELDSQHRAVPRELIDWVMEVADQWRAVDAEDERPCRLAGRVLRLAGSRELAWGYVTSPSFLPNGNARAWLELARQQYEQKEYDFAERAYAVAASLEPNNAEIIRERAFNRHAAECAR